MNIHTFLSGLFGSTLRAQAAFLAIALILSGIAARANQSVELIAGTTINISVLADEGTVPFTYQWRKNGSNLSNGGNISGATTANLVLSNVSSANLGTYTAVVTNSAGSTTSDQAIIVAATVFPPAITIQPFHQTVLVGGDVALIVAANGSTPLSYQWKKDGVDIPGATSTDFLIGPVAATDFGIYTVVVSNSAGTIESNPAIITDGAVPPFFGSTLQSQTAAPGETVTFDIAPSGSTPLTYQWRRNGVNLTNGGIISGATTTTLTLTGVTSVNNGFYTLIATNSAGSSTSNEATLNVVTPPSTDQAPAFVVSPVPKTVTTNENAIFVAEVAARPEATYQWQKNGVNLVSIGKYGGADTPILTIYNATGADAGTYRLVATNAIGSTTSVGALLTVLTQSAPIFTTQPVSQTAMTGQAAFFTFVASGYPAPLYRWRKNGVNLVNGDNISGVFGTTLAISNVTSADIGTYSVVATNLVASVASDDVTLSINGSPAIFTQPQSLTIVSSGSVVPLSVTVAGDPTPTIQWRKNGTNLANGGVVSGSTTGTLTLSNVSSADSGKYSVVVTNSQGTVTSSDFEVVVLASNVSNQPVTTGKDVALSAPEATGSVQWQISNDLGVTWTNLTNNGTYSGATTNTLHIAAASTQLNNSLFRLVTAGTTTVLHSTRLNVIQAFLPFPVSLTSDASGNLYVADASSDMIGKISPSMELTMHAGRAGQTGTTDGSGTNARFNDPSGVTSAPDGTLAVADKANATLRIVSPTGAVTTLAGSTTLRGNVDGTGSSATFSAPLGVTRDSAGDYYIADSMNHTIRKVTAAGVVTTLAGAAGQAGSADGIGSVARFNSPTGIDVDLGGNVYVADTTNNTIRKITPSGMVTTVAGLSGVSGTSNGTGANALFNQPSGLAVDSAANIYVADTANSTVRRITPAGVVSTIAGLPGIAGLKDGSGLGSWFNQPRDISVSSTGSVYVADTGNSSIRRIDQNGAVTTLALTVPTSTDGSPNPPFPDVPPLPSTPSLPTVPSTPTLPTAPTQPTAPSSGGGGGGAPSLWFFGALGVLWLVQRRQKR